MPDKKGEKAVPPPTGEIEDLSTRRAVSIPQDASAMRRDAADPAVYDSAAEDPQRFLGVVRAGARVAEAAGTRCSKGAARMRAGSSAARSTPSVNCLDRHVAGPRAEQGGA